MVRDEEPGKQTDLTVSPQGPGDIAEDVRAHHALLPVVTAVVSALGVSLRKQNRERVGEWTKDRVLTVLCQKLRPPGLRMTVPDVASRSSSTVAVPESSGKPISSHAWFSTVALNVLTPTGAITRSLRSRRSWAKRSESMGSARYVRERRCCASACHLPASGIGASAMAWRSARRTTSRIR